jgi:hypothetical protein
MSAMSRHSARADVGTLGLSIIPECDTETSHIPGLGKTGSASRGAVMQPCWVWPPWQYIHMDTNAAFLWDDSSLRTPLMSTRVVALQAAWAAGAGVPWPNGSCGSSMNCPTTCSTGVFKRCQRYRLVRASCPSAALHSYVVAQLAAAMTCCCCSVGCFSFVTVGVCGRELLILSNCRVLNMVSHQQQPEVP